MGVLGRIEPAVWPEMLKAASPRLSTTIACTTIMSPTDATSRASGGELRSGRKTRTKISKPSAAAYTSAISSAGTVAMPPLKMGTRYGSPTTGSMR